MAEAQKRKIKRGVSYDRVSTLGQVVDVHGIRREDASPDSQRKRCVDYVKFLSQQKGFEYKIIDHLSDEGFSGKDLNRPAFQQMWDLISIRSIDFIVAAELSRLSRNVVDFLDLVSHCEKNQVDIFVIGLSLDTSTPIGRVLVIILIALASFEREMTGIRVRENALTRLLKDGKINGSAEILGLVKDPQRTGHYIIDHDEVERLEKTLKLFLKLSSKKKLLQTAREIGLMGKKGRELTQHTIDTIMENVRWRYRGLWYANKDNKDADTSILPESRHYQLVKLPHGPVIDAELLDAVQNKLDETYTKKNQSGKNNHIYLLSHVLVYEDGTHFSGQPGKGLQYRYYYNKQHKIRIRCDEIEPFVMHEVKIEFESDERFSTLVEDAIKRRQSELPKVESQIRQIQKRLKDLVKTSAELRDQLTNKDRRGQPGFMDWLAGQVETVTFDQGKFQLELEALERVKQELLRTSGLGDLQGQVKKLLGRFESLSPVEQRNFIEKVVNKIVVKPGNRLDLHICGGSPTSTTVTLRKQSTEVEVNGGSEGTRTLGLRRDRAAL